jgi:hypothetical protein
MTQRTFVSVESAAILAAVVFCWRALRSCRT